MNLLSLLLITILNILFISSANNLKHTIISKRAKQLSSRLKRSLLLPNYGSVKVTVGIGRAIIGNNPKGLSSSYEFCAYFAGPTNVKDWFNEISNKPKKKQVETFNKNKNHVVDQHFWKTDIHQGYANLLGHYVPKISNSSNTSFKDRNEIQGIMRKSSSNPEHVQSRMMKNPLDKAFTFLFGADLKCGILKSISRGKKFLLPPGYSMIQDVIRIIVLTLDEDFASGETITKLYPECDFDKKYSFDFLDWVLNAKVVQ